MGLPWKGSLLCVASEVTKGKLRTSRCIWKEGGITLEERGVPLRPNERHKVLGQTPLQFTYKTHKSQVASNNDGSARDNTPKDSKWSSVSNLSYLGKMRALTPDLL